MIVEISNLTKKYGNHVLFDGLSVSIPNNKLTCIYGSSGCGKTTLLNIIGMIENYTTGIITYDDKIVKNQQQRRKLLSYKIGFIFQDFGLVENETVYQNMLIVKNIKKMKNRRNEISKVLESLQLKDFIDRKVFELSGGEQQRVALAKILLKDVDLILADEPTASLDKENKEIVLKSLRQLVEQGKTVVVVSHDEEMLNFSDNKIDLSEKKIKNNKN